MDIINIINNKNIHWFENINQNHFNTKKEIFSKIITEDSLVIDIGAYVGYFSLLFNECVGKKGKVLSFEPNPTTYKILEKYSKLNNSNIIPYNLAITPENKKYNFNYTNCEQWGIATNGGYFENLEHKQSLSNVHNQVVEVEGVNLIDFLNKNYKDQISNISLIKIDTEGNDKEIIKTLKPIIDQIQPNILTEAFQSLSISEIKDFYDSINDLGYKIFDVSPMDDLSTSCGPLTLEEVEYYIYKVNGNGNMLCIHENNLHKYGLKNYEKNKNCVILVGNNNTDLSNLDSYVENFDEVIYVDMGYKDIPHLYKNYQKHPNKIKHIPIPDFIIKQILEDKYSDDILYSSLGFNIGLKNTNSEWIAFGDLNFPSFNKHDLKFSLEKFSLYRINNILLGTKNLFDKIQGAEEIILEDIEIIKQNIIKKSMLCNFQVFTNQPFDISKTWFIDYDLHVKDGFYHYETFVSYNNMMGLSNVKIETENI